MLTPEYYNYCTDDIIELYSRLNESITRDIARRIVKTGYVTEGAKWQIAVEREAGLLYDDAISKVAEYSDSSEAAVKAIFEDAGIISKDFDDEIYRSAGKTPIPLKASPAMLQVLSAGIAKTNGLISNLTKTTALSAQNAFIEACALAEMEITSGAFDYNTAIRHAVDDAISQGSMVEYASGARMNVEAAVRRAVLTGVSQTTGEISLANAKELGTNLMEITAHGGARPDHANWQGKIVCIEGKRKGYLTLTDIGYGTATGFKGVNCRHDWYPFVEGISTRAYTDKQLKSYQDKTVMYNGEEMSQYEAEQKQRIMERQIRDERRRLAGYDEAIKNANSQELKNGLQSEFDLLSYKMKKHESKYADFCKQTGLPSQKDRLGTKGFNRSVSQKAVYANKNLQFIHNDAKMKAASGLPKKIDLPDEKLRHTINVDIGGSAKLPKIDAVVPKGSTLTDVYVMAGKDTSTPIRDLRRLYSTYGYSAQGWQKKSGTVIGKNFTYTVHWYENNGFIPIDEIKLKGVGKAK